VRLIDWGLAEFYHNKKDFPCRVGTKFYKAPELFLNMFDYDYSIDMWSFGATFAAIIFKKTPFFNGTDNNDQFIKITQVLGTDALYSMMDKYGLKMNKELSETTVLPHQRTPWKSLIDDNNKLARPDALDFVDRVLRYDPQARLTASEALDHPYLWPLKKKE